MKKKHKHHHDWSHLKDTRLRYEKPNTMHFSAGEAYANAEIWKTCEFCGKEFMGNDLLQKHRSEADPETHRSGEYKALLEAVVERGDGVWTSLFTAHSHSIEEMNAGILRPGKTCADCPEAAPSAISVVMAVDPGRSTVIFGADKDKP